MAVKVLPKWHVPTVLKPGIEFEIYKDPTDGVVSKDSGSELSRRKNCPRSRVRRVVMRFLTLLTLLTPVFLTTCAPIIKPLEPTAVLPSPPSPTRTARPANTDAELSTQQAGAQVTAFEALHVRAAPNPEAKVLDYLYVGEDVVLTGKCLTGWAQIEWQDGTAWVRAKFLSENKCSEER